MKPASKTACSIDQQPADDVLDDEFRVCSNCSAVKPLRDFRKRKHCRFGRGHRCTACTNRQLRTAARQRRLKQRRHWSRELAGQLAMSRDLATVSQLIRSVARKLGGIDRLAAEVVNSLRRSRPGSRDSLVMYRGLLRLIELESKAQHELNDAEQREIASLSDAELERQIERNAFAPPN